MALQSRYTGRGGAESPNSACVSEGVVTVMTQIVRVGCDKSSDQHGVEYG